jgi:hypothetical protein
MKNKKDNRPSTPLGELFDKADFPFEPAAWSQMETLLSEVPAQKKAGFNGIKRIIGLIFLGIMLIGGSVLMLKQDKSMVINQSPFNAENEKIVQTNFTEHTKGGPLPNGQAGSVFEAKKEYFEAKKEGNIAPNPTINKADVSLNYTPKSNFANTFFMGEKIDYSTFKNTLLSNQNNQNMGNKGQKWGLLLEKRENNSPFETSNNNGSLSISTKTDSNFQAIPPQYFEQKLASNNDVFFSEKIKTDSNTQTTPPQYFEPILAQKSNSGLTMEDVYVPEKRAYYAAFDPLSISETPTEINSEFSYDFAPYGWAMDDMKAIQRPLWQGKKHQLYFGLGIIGNISSFHLKYARRITPLLGLGMYYYQAKDDFSSYINFSDLGLETQFYIINRRHFECVLSVSYAYTSGSVTYQPVHPELKSDFTFGAGLELRYCLNQSWNLGFRADMKKETANLLLQLGYRF